MRPGPAWLGLVRAGSDAVISAADTSSEIICDFARRRSLAQSCAESREKLKFTLARPLRCRYKAPF